MPLRVLQHKLFGVGRNLFLLSVHFDLMFVILVLADFLNIQVFFVGLVLSILAGRVDGFVAMAQPSIQSIVFNEVRSLGERTLHRAFKFSQIEIICSEEICL